MRVIVAGATAWNNEAAIRRELAKLPKGTTIIHGDSLGADALSGQIAAQLGLAVESMAKNKDDYARFRQGAWKGLNERMLASEPGLVLIFHPDIEAGRGSTHLMKLAKGTGIEVRVFVE